MERYVESITHKGVVERVDTRERKVWVRLDSDKECGGCPAASLCHASDRDGNVIEIETPIAGVYRKGERVVAEGTEALHRKAVMLATVLPCIALLAVMVGVYIMTLNQILAVMCGLGSTIVFYLVLYVCRDKIAREFRFTLRRE